MEHENLEILADLIAFDEAAAAPAAPELVPHPRRLAQSEFQPDYSDALHLPADESALDSAIAELDPEEQALVAQIKALAS